MLNRTRVGPIAAGSQTLHMQLFLIRIAFHTQRQTNCKPCPKSAVLNTTGGVSSTQKVVSCWGNLGPT